MQKNRPFIRSVFMRSRVKRGNKIVLTFSLNNKNYAVHFSYFTYDVIILLFRKRKDGCK